MKLNRSVRCRRGLAMGALVIATGLGFAPGAADAASLMAPSKQSLTDSNRDCNGSFISSPTKTGGSAIMVETPPFHVVPSFLTALVTVRDATPNASYNVRIIQDGAGGLVGSCNVVVGQVRTDSKGNGLTIGATTLLAGATSWYVDLNNAQNFGDYLDTDSVSISG